MSLDPGRPRGLSGRALMGLMVNASAFREFRKEYRMYDEKLMNTMFDSIRGIISPSTPVRFEVYESPATPTTLTTIRFGDLSFTVSQAPASLSMARYNSQDPIVGEMDKAAVIAAMSKTFQNPAKQEELIALAISVSKAVQPSFYFYGYTPHLNQGMMSGFWTLRGHLRSKSNGEVISFGIQVKVEIPGANARYDSYGGGSI